MAKFKTLDDLNVAGKRVLVRVDLNVPMLRGRVTDLTRIERILPTIKELMEKNARVVLLSHFGRPKGRVVLEMSLKPIARALQVALAGPRVNFSDDCIGPVAEQAIKRLKDGEIIMLENLRFHSGEESNDPIFARQLATLGQIYVNDAFSASHRAHASVDVIARLVPSAAGRLMEVELNALSKVLERPERPLMAIVGGAKVSTKLDLLGNLSGKVDMLVIGGGMANTFLYALGRPIGRSLGEASMADTARAVLAAAKKQGCEIVLPTDVVVATALAKGVPTQTVPIASVPADRMILDVGPETIRALETRLSKCKTLVWNGPLGAFEIPPFDVGTTRVAQAAAALTKKGQLVSVAGGGDTVAALAHAGVVGDFSYVSTAGGAFLEWLEGKTLPGVAALEKWA
ncbi:MAG: phosphoglycerate kinase [Alphaproteobacteria bacterium]